jgi:hypothetical protein
MVRFARVAVVLVALAGCGGGGGSSSSSPPAESEPTTTTAPEPAAIDVRRPIPAGSLYDTPRPPLENTGDDYVAIFESLAANFRWLTENPDPAVISEIYVPGTAEHDAGVRNFTELTDNAWRAADDGYHLLKIETLSASDGVAILRVVDQMEFEQIVDNNGTRVGEGIAHDGVKEWTVILSRDTSGSWHIADWAPAEGPTVEL